MSPEKNIIFYDRWRFPSVPLVFLRHFHPAPANGLYQRADHQRGMAYIPNPVFIEEEGAFNIISGPKNTILPAIGAAISSNERKPLYITDNNTTLYRSLQVFHDRLDLFQWDFPDQILSRLRINKPAFAVIEYNRYLFNGNPDVIRNTGRELKRLAESTGGSYLMVSTFMDDDLLDLCEWADRVLIVDDAGTTREEDFVFKDMNTGCYMKRQKTMADFM